MTAVPVLNRSLKYKVSVLKGESTKPGFSFDQLIDKGVVTIGRGPENDLVFANDIRMSRAHAEIRIEGGQLYVRNISSKNFVLVDGEKVSEKQIVGESQVQVGEAIFKIAVSTGLAAAPMALVRTDAATPINKANPVANKSYSPGPQTAGYQQPGGFQSAAGNQQQTQQNFRPKTNVASGGGSRARFYGIIAILAIGGYWFLTSGPSTKKVEIGLRTDGDIIKSIEQSAGAVDQIRKQKESRGEESLQYKTAQEHYVRGFRDYRNGQYGRAIESFQAALSFFPSHELARKYLMESQKKFDESIKFHMNQGRKYYGKNNFRLCRSSFANVMIMIKRPDDKTYREAKQYYSECQLRLEGRY